MQKMPSTKGDYLSEIEKWTHLSSDIKLPTNKTLKNDIVSFYEKYKPESTDNVAVSIPSSDMMKEFFDDKPTPEDHTPFKETDLKETGITEIKSNVGEELAKKELPVLEAKESPTPVREKKTPIKAKRNPPEDGYKCYDIITAHLKVSKEPFNFLYMKVEDRTTMQDDMKRWHESRYAHIPPEQRPILKYGKLDYKTFFRDVLSQHEGKLTTLKDMYDRFHV